MFVCLLGKFMIHYFMLKAGCSCRIYQQNIRVLWNRFSVTTVTLSYSHKVFIIGSEMCFFVHYTKPQNRVLCWEYSDQCCTVRMELSVD